MMKRSWVHRIVRNALIWGVPGAVALGTSCVESIRDSIVSGGLDYVEGTTESILDAVVPVDELIPGE